MKPVKSKANPPDKQRLAAIIALSVSAGFLMFFITPFDIFLHNPADFAVSWSFLITPLLISSIVVSLGIMGVFFYFIYNKIIIIIALHIPVAIHVIIVHFAQRGFSEAYLLIQLAIAIVGSLLLWIALDIKFKDKPKNKLIDIGLLLGTGLLVSAQIQTLFLNGGMSQITGQIVFYDRLMVIGNGVIWLLITAFPLCLWLLLKRKNKDIKYEKAVIFIAFLIFGMQLTGLISTAVRTELPEGYDERGMMYFSYEALLDLNEESNVIVFLADTLDGKYMEKILSEYSEMYELLDGFTYYSNYVSEYVHTFPSVATMLTGHFF